MEPVPPISRRERSIRGVDPVQRPRLLTPAEREEARRERERLGRRMEPVPPISRRERSIRGVDPVQRPRLLTPAEREEARRERERRRSENTRKSGAQDSRDGVDHTG